MIWLNCILILCLSVIAYQDFKSKTVSWILFPILAIVGGIAHKHHATWIAFGISIGINLALVALVVLVLFLYAKYKINKPFLEAVFGLGDVLMLLAFAFLFPTLSFLNFFVFSLLFSLIISLFLRFNRGTSTVPLAGLIGLFLIAVYGLYWAGLTPNIYTM